MEDGATGFKLANAALAVSNDSNDIVTSRHRDQKEDLVQDPVHEKVTISMVSLYNMFCRFEI